MTRHVLISALLITSLCGCDNEPGEGKPKAEVAAPEAPPAAAPTAEAAADKAAAGVAVAGPQAVYTFSQEDSKLAFVGAKVTGKHDGSFEKFVGTIKLAGTDITKGSVNVEVETGSVKADADKLTKHLKSPDFFNAAEIPKATFVSTAIKAGGTGGATHTVTGNLNLHGIEKSISFPATIAISDGKVTVAAEFVINRKDFGIVYAGMADDLIKDDVLLKLDLKAAPQSQS